MTAALDNVTFRAYDRLQKILLRVRHDPTRRKDRSGRAENGHPSVQSNEDYQYESIDN